MLFRFRLSACWVLNMSTVVYLPELSFEFPRPRVSQSDKIENKRENLCVRTIQAIFRPFFFCGSPWKVFSLEITVDTVDTYEKKNMLIHHFPMRFALTVFANKKFDFAIVPPTQQYNIVVFFLPSFPSIFCDQIITISCSVFSITLFFTSPSFLRLFFCESIQCVDRSLDMAHR